jgi:hypothetical protein
MALLGDDYGQNKHLSLSLMRSVLESEGFSAWPTVATNIGRWKDKELLAKKAKIFRSAETEDLAMLLDSKCNDSPTQESKPCEEESGLGKISKMCNYVTDPCGMVSAVRRFSTLSPRFTQPLKKETMEHLLEYLALEEDGEVMRRTLHGLFRFFAPPSESLVVGLGNLGYKREYIPTSAYRKIAQLGLGKIREILKNNRGNQDLRRLILGTLDYHSPKESQDLLIQIIDEADHDEVTLAAVVQALGALKTPLPDKDRVLLILTLKREQQKAAKGKQVP